MPARESVHTSYVYTKDKNSPEEMFGGIRKKFVNGKVYQEEKY